MATRKINLIITGLAIGHNELTGLEFDKDEPFRCCLICGDVYQTELDRCIVSEKEKFQAAYRRHLWAASHAKTHTLKEHEQLKASGNTMTPEAVHRLAAFGIIPMVDAVTSDEINHALFESSPIPFNDSQS